MANQNTASKGEELIWHLANIELDSSASRSSCIKIAQSIESHQRVLVSSTYKSTSFPGSLSRAGERDPGNEVAYK